jgi:hypothetical protein
MFQRIEDIPVTSLNGWDRFPSVSPSLFGDEIDRLGLNLGFGFGFGFGLSLSLV